MFLTDEARDFFDSVTAGLDAAGVKWTRTARLVRGLDYYRHTAFEFVTDRLGAQGTVLGGGRYDGLIEALGGPHTPAVGWAAGIERLGMLLDAAQPSRHIEQTVDLSFKAHIPDIEIVPHDRGDEAATACFADELRRRHFSVVTSYSGNPNKRFEKARNRIVASTIGVYSRSESRAEFKIVNNVAAPDEFQSLRHRIGKLPGMTELEVKETTSGAYSIIWIRTGA